MKLPDREWDIIREALSRNFSRLQYVQTEYNAKLLSGAQGYVQFENDALLAEMHSIGELHRKLCGQIR